MLAVTVSDDTVSIDGLPLPVAAQLLAVLEVGTLARLAQHQDTDTVALSFLAERLTQALAAVERQRSDSLTPVEWLRLADWARVVHVSQSEARRIAASGQLGAAAQKLGRDWLVLAGTGLPTESGRHDSEHRHHPAAPTL